MGCARRLLIGLCKTKKTFIATFIVGILCFVVVTELYMHPVDRYTNDSCRTDGSHDYLDAFSADLGHFPENQNCSVKIFQQFIGTYNFFPTQGRWMKEAKNRFVRFTPFMCHFNGTIPAVDCLERLGASRVLLLGDSNGRRYFDALSKLIAGQGSTKCGTIKEERGETGQLQTDAGYFRDTPGLNFSNLVTHGRDCGTCKSTLVRCLTAGERRLHTIDLEFLTMEYSLDTEVTTLRTARRGTCAGGQTFNCHHSNTHQEFIFAEYLKGRPPQLIMVFVNSHDMRRYNLGQIRTNVAYLVNTVQQYVPRSTTVMWVPLHDHTPSKYLGGFRNFMYEHGQFNSSEEIRRVNKVWFDVLKPYLRQQGTNMLPFFDLQSISKEVLPAWSDMGGVHMMPWWYNHIMEYIMQTLCS